MHMDALILRRRTVFGLLVALVALAGSFVTVKNQLVQDDVPMILEDGRMADPARWGEFLNQTYWPAPLVRDLYRPLTSLLVAVEGKLGSGTPIGFKIVQVALYLASCIAVFGLALRLLPPRAALLAGLLFAAHPVHVEAVALAVNQAEVIVGLICAAAVAWYIGLRRRGELSPRHQAALALATLIAVHFKESGVMLPVLLFGAEWIPAARRWREGRTAVLSLVTWQTLAVVIAVVLRMRIEFDSPSGTFVAEAFEHEAITGRFLTMLRIVPEWFRLLLWPATLSADYSPGLIVPATAWGLDQTLGACLLGLIALLGWRLRRTAPVATFGIWWCAAGLFPVHNVLLPTGIALAERTMYLPSIGAMLTVGALTVHLDLLRGRIVERCVMAVATLLIFLGILRSHSRHQVWRTANQLWVQTVIDNPDGYRPMMAVGAMLYNAGQRERGMHFFERSIELWDRQWGARWQLATWHRRDGRCDLAIPHYLNVLRIKEVEVARASLVACLVWEGRYEEAKSQAAPGIGGESFGPAQRVWYRLADSAAKARVPAHTLVFPESQRHLLRPETTGRVE